MLTQYAYIKPRYQFGKQCVFADAYAGVEDIYPDPELTQDYILKAHCDRGTSMQKQYALHEVQTERKVTTSTGIMHSEGGWPKEINPKDTELVQRFRRRMEKDDNWPIIMRGLLPTMERHVLQNNAVNIYQNFFDDLIPTPMVKHYNLRITNLYEDPETKIRPVRHLSWSPNQSQRLAVAYGFMEFEEHPDDVSPYSYVWDIVNPNKALLKLKSSSPLMTIEYNSRDPVLLVSGLTSGQVCCWDIRASDEPVQMSHPYVSHKHPAIQALWIPSKANTDFFSSSMDGTVLWWDIRFLKKPTETLVMDLEQPERADVFRGAGVTALQYEPTMSSKFLAGTENGLVVNVNRRTPNPLEKLAIRFRCYTGPVVAIDRNPLYTKNFLTIGDWSAKIWADDTKEGCFLTTRQREIDLSGGCWSKSRCSVFFVINREGMLEAYDILAGMKNPLTAIRVCRDSLTAIKSHEHGEFLAVGSRNGNVYLLECSDDFSSFSKEDRAALSNYLERCSRYEKAIDTRLKEIRVMQTADVQVSFRHERPAKPKKKETREKKDQKDQRKKDKSMDKDRTDSRKRSGRLPRPKGKVSAKMSSPELIDAEMSYFKKIEEEAAKYTEIDPADFEAAEALLKERTVTKPEEDESEHEKEDLKKRRSIRRIKSRLRAPMKAVRKSRETVEEKAKDDAEAESRRRKDSRARGKRTLKKTCPPTVVCKPEICCLDLEEKRRTRLRKKAKEEEREAIADAEADAGAEEEEEESVVRSRSFVIDNKWFRRLTDYIAQIPQPPRAIRHRILAAKDAPPKILREELDLAKKEIRAWQQSAIARTLSTWAFEEKLEARVPKKVEVVLDAKQDSEKSTTFLMDDDVKKDVRKLDIQPLPKKRSRLRKAKKLVLTQEEIEKLEEEEQKKLWRKLKQKVKRFDEQHAEKKVTYPRISAAFVRTSSDELVTDNSKNEVSTD